MDVVTDLARAREVVRDRGFDLVVANAYPTDGSGVETVSGIREIAPGLPALLLSGYGIDPELRRLVDAGEIDFLTIPFAAQSLAAGITRALRQRPTTRMPSTQAPTRESRGRFQPAAPVWLATAAVLALGIGLSYRTYLASGPTPPVLPPPTAGDVRRGGELKLVEPVGDLAELPTSFAWQPWPGASSYRLVVRGADPDPLWTSGTATPSATIPKDLRHRLHRAVLYRWSVEALDLDLKTLTTSPEGTFRALPDIEKLESVSREEATRKELMP